MNINNPTNIPATVNSNVTQWRGTAVAVPGTAGVPTVDVGRWRNAVPSTLRATGEVRVSVERWFDGAVLAMSAAGFPRVDVARWATGINSALVDGKVQSAPLLELVADGLEIHPAQPAVGLTVTSAAVAHTYGAFVEFIASTAEDLYVIGINDRNGTAEAYTVFELATGAGGSEVALTEFPIYAPNGFGDDPGVLMLPGMGVFVAAGTRLAIHTADVNPTAKTKVVHLLTVPVAHLAALDGA